MRQLASKEAGKQQPTLVLSAVTSLAASGGCGHEDDVMQPSRWGRCCISGRQSSGSQSGTVSVPFSMGTVLHRIVGKRLTFDQAGNPLFSIQRYTVSTATPKWAATSFTEYQRNSSDGMLSEIDIDRLL